MAQPPIRLTAAGFRRGMSDLGAASVAVVLFGVGFGAAAVEAGLSPVAALAMSATVFAGASQYAVLEFWHAPLPLLALIVTTLAVNARHVVLGATLAPHLAAIDPLRRHAALALLSDANWAATHKAMREGERDIGHLVGGGAVLWICWAAGTAAGALIGHSLGDLERFGIDALMPVFFACALIGMADDLRDVPPWALAGLSAGVLSMVIAAQWAILAGAFGGALYGTVRDARR